MLPRVGGRLWGRERKRWRARQHVTGGGAPGRPWWVCKQPSSSPTFVRRPATHTPRGASARTAAAESVAAAASDGVYGTGPILGPVLVVLVLCMYVHGAVRVHYTVHARRLPYLKHT